MKRCVKIICTYFGRRRSMFNTPNNMQDYISKNIDNEINIENGIRTDIILVNNDCKDSDLNIWIDKYNDIKTKNGKIIVEHRQNIGGSFGSYFDMFKKYCDDYDYWFFSEDDHTIFKEGYMKDFVDYLDSDEKIGYVCLAPITPLGLNGFPIHSGGGIGLTSTEKFKMIYGENSQCNLRETMALDMAYEKLQGYESKFNANFILYGGLELKHHPKYSCIPNNYLNFKSNYKNYLNEEVLQKEFIYSVGE